MSGPAVMSHFPSEALEANRAGRLTETQGKNWAGADRNWRGNVRLIAFVLGLAGILMVRGAGQTPFPARPLLGAVCLALAAYLVYVSTLGGGALTRDLSEGRVETVEGAIGKEGRGWAIYSGPNPERCYLHIGGERLACSRPAYDVAPQAGIVRAYYLPRSRRLINLERLPDRPLPASALDQPLDAIKQAFSAAGFGDRTQQAEAMATVEAIKDAIFGEAPHTGTAESRPLAEAIVGKWRNPLMSATFSADGAAAATTADGMALAGRWSIAGGSKLRLSGMGQEIETDASVAGDVLSCVMEGKRLNFRRVGSDSP
jgi:hypothetical protein